MDTLEDELGDKLFGRRSDPNERMKRSLLRTVALDW